MLSAVRRTSLCGPLTKISRPGTTLSIVRHFSETRRDALLEFPEAREQVAHGGKVYHFTSPVDSADIAVHMIGSGDPSTPAVFLVPGVFTDHRFWLGTKGTSVGRKIAEHGYTVYVIEQRGHGFSTKSPEDVANPKDGHIWCWQDWVQDTAQAMRLIKERHEGRPIAGIGHSAGSATLMCAATLCETGTLGCFIKMSIATPSMGIRRIMANHLGRLLTRIYGEFPAKQLGFGGINEIGTVFLSWSYNNNTGRYHKVPPWEAKNTPDFDTDACDYMIDIQRMLDMPVASLTGWADRLWADPDDAKVFLDMLPSKDRTMKLFGKKFGHLKDYDHPDIIASKEAQQDVWPYIVEWLNAHRKTLNP
eukprot:Clim_evm81s210 gene=Clim_evmTU81s210